MSRIFGNGNSLWGVFFGSRCARVSTLAALAIMLLATPAWAQRYKEIDPKLTDGQARALDRTVGQAIRDRAGFGANAGAVEDYFKKYYFPKMTQTDPDSLAELGDRREDLFRRYIRVAANAESQATLTDQTLNVVEAISQGGYHPAVRYNAVLILGNLDQKIAGGRANPTPPIPLPAATAVMLGLLEQEDFKGVKVHPSVQLGALVGLERHARFGIAPEHAERVTKAALDVMAQEDSPEEVPNDVHHMMRCRAASVLASQHRKKPDAEVQTALDALMINEKLDLDDRCFVVGLMKMLDYTQADGVDSAATVAALGSLSRDVMKAGAEVADEYQQEILGNGGGGMNRRNMFRGDGRRGGDDGPKFERRRLLSRLRAIYNGGNSLIEGAPDATKARLQSLLDAMKPARVAAADKNMVDLDIVEAVLQADRDVDQMVQSWKQVAAPAKPVGDEAS